MKKVKFDVFGMTCSSCQSHVEKAVNKIDDVKKVNVNLLSNEMLVEFDETKIDEKRIIKAVIKATSIASNKISALIPFSLSKSKIFYIEIDVFAKK